MEKKKAARNRLHMLAAAASVLSISYLIWVQFAYLNTFAASWDQVDFALALERFDLMAMQPHFPGYPYFILGGKFIHLWVEGEASSLTVFNIVAYLSALWPMYFLAKKVFNRPLSLFLAALLYSSSYTLIIVNQPMSEGAALACLWWYFWSLDKARKENSRKAAFLPLFLFSVLLGIRLSYLPFAVGLLYLFYKKKYSKKQIFFHAIGAMLLQLVWVGALVFSEGSLKGFVKLSLAFTSGHFNSWGNTAADSSVPFWERAKILLADNLLWTGAFSQSFLLAALYIFVIGLFCYRWKRNKLYVSPAGRLAVVMSLAYFFWALFAQNIDKPRHILPVAELFLFLFFMTVLKNSSRKLLFLFVVVILVGQSYHTASLLKEQADQEPATYQLARYLKALDEPAAVYVWEEARVLEYVAVSVPYKEVETYPFFLHDQSYYRNRKIFLTDKVLKGFEEQGEQVRSRVKKVAEFQSNALFNPVYDRIVLYEWLP